MLPRPNGCTVSPVELEPRLDEIMEIEYSNRPADGTPFRVPVAITALGIILVLDASGV